MKEREGNKGAATFQEIFQVHMHVIPRFQGNAFKIEADWESKPSREELDRIAARIRRADERLKEREVRRFLLRPAIIMQLNG